MGSLQRLAPVRASSAFVACALLLLVSSVDSQPEHDPCAEESIPSVWGMRGGGFHQQFVMQLAPVFDSVTIGIPVTKNFFIDAAEAEQQYELYLSHRDENKDLSRPISGIDITALVDSFSVRSTYPFDIEVPSFHIEYTVNDATITMHLNATAVAERVAAASAVAVGEESMVVLTLVFPIHLRYEQVDTDTPLSLDSVLQIGHSKHTVCLSGVSIDGLSSQCTSDPDTAREPRRITAVLSTHPSMGLHHCSDTPIGVLAHLPLVYWTLMALLSSGALSVYVALR